jgi:hypothetical protein
MEYIYQHPISIDACVAYAIATKLSDVARESLISCFVPKAPDSWQMREILNSEKKEGQDGP